MAYQRANAISYIGEDDVADLSDIGLLRKFKADTGMILTDEDGTQTFNIIDSLEDADGYAFWELERTSPNVLMHTQVWESEVDYDDWCVAYIEDGNTLEVGEDWEVDTVESTVEIDESTDDESTVDDDESTDDESAT